MKLKRVSFTLSKKIVKLLQAIIILTAIALPLFQYSYINPAFEDLLIQNSEEEALHVAHRLQRYVIEDAANQNAIIPDTLEAYFQLTANIENYLSTAMLDFDLWKIKIFNQLGEVIYSSDIEDIGSVNTKPYFQDQLAKGLPYTKTEYKTINQGDEFERLYLVETYVPIILSDGKFIGAFELYYDITERKNRLILLAGEIMTIILWLSTISFVLAIIMGKALNILRTSRTNYEEGLLSQATKDKLTNVFNRHSIDDYLEHSVVQFYDNKTDHCLVMFDIDHFKQVNDVHGHQAGDDVLKNLAEIVQQRLRETDILGRYGGEEFIIILPNTNESGGNAFAESLRKLIANTPIPTIVGDLNITVSIGVGSFADIEDLTPQSLVKKVDEAMYASKHAGRNRVTYVRV